MKVYGTVRRADLSLMATAVLSLVLGAGSHVAWADAPRSPPPPPLDGAPFDPAWSAALASARSSVVSADVVRALDHPFDRDSIHAATLRAGYAAIQEGAVAHIDTALTRRFPDNIEVSFLSVMKAHRIAELAIVHDATNGKEAAACHRAAAIVALDSANIATAPSLFGAVIAEKDTIAALRLARDFAKRPGAARCPELAGAVAKVGVDRSLLTSVVDNESMRERSNTPLFDRIVLASDRADDDWHRHFASGTPAPSPSPARNSFFAFNPIGKYDISNYQLSAVVFTRLDRGFDDLIVAKREAVAALNR